MINREKKACRCAAWATLLLLAGAASAATIVTSDDKQVSGTITGLDGGSLVVQPSADEPATVKVPLWETISISFTWQERVSSTNSNAAPATAPKALTKWRTEFGRGDRLTAGLAAWTDAGLTLSAETLGSGTFTVPVDQVKALWSTSDSQVKKAKEVEVQAPGQDVVYVLKTEKDEKDATKTKDSVQPVMCLVTGVEGDFLNVKYEGQTRGLKLEKVVGVVLAQREMAPETELYEVFTLSTGEVVSGKIASLDKNVFKVQALSAKGAQDEARMIAVPLWKIDKVAVNNGRIVWLGDLKPAKVEQAAYLDRLMPYRVNQSLTSGALMLQDGAVDHGIAVHSKCFLTYDIDGSGAGFERFKTKVGFQQPEGKIGRAAIRVIGDDKVLWEEADFKGDAKPVTVDVPVAGIKSLRLEVDYGKDQDVGDRVIWGDARLLRPATK